MSADLGSPGVIGGSVTAGASATLALSPLFQILSRSSGFFVCRRFSLVGRHFLSPATVYLPEKVSPATFPITESWP